MKYKEMHREIMEILNNNSRNGVIHKKDFHTLADRITQEFCDPEEEKPRMTRQEKQKAFIMVMSIIAGLALGYVLFNARWIELSAITGVFFCLILPLSIAGSE